MEHKLSKSRAWFPKQTSFGLEKIQGDDPLQDASNFLQNI